MPLHVGLCVLVFMFAQPGHMQGQQWFPVYETRTPGVLVFLEAPCTKI